MTKVLLIEDNPDIVANLYGFLEPRGYELDHARNGFLGLGLVTEHTYDVIVLDLGLPGLDGLALCRQLRRDLQSSVPVLMLTARDTVPDKVAGFESGADDYLVKPFSLLELEARLQALLRRGQSLSLEAVIRVGSLQLDLATYEVRRDGQRLMVTPFSFKLLALLMRAAPRVVKREELERELWGDNPPASDALRTHVHALRQAIDKPFPTKMLKTVPGIGLQLAVPAHDV